MFQVYGAYVTVKDVSCFMVYTWLLEITFRILRCVCYCSIICSTFYSIWYMFHILQYILYCYKCFLLRCKRDCCRCFTFMVQMFYMKDINYTAVLQQRCFWCWCCTWKKFLLWICYGPYVSGVDVLYSYSVWWVEQLKVKITVVKLQKSQHQMAKNAVLLPRQQAGLVWWRSRLPERKQTKIRQM